MDGVGPRLRPFRLLVRVSAVLAGLSAVAFASSVVVASSRLTSGARISRPVRVGLSESPASGCVRLHGPGHDRPGVWGVEGSDGSYRQVGVVVTSSSDWSDRRVAVDFTPHLPPPSVPAASFLDRVAFPPDAVRCRAAFPTLEVVDVASPSGRLPLWRILPSGRCDAAVLAVHGRGVSPSEQLRLAPQAADAGLAFLSASYRNDPASGPSGAPSSFGLREADDVLLQLDSAAGWGVRRVVLAGTSMGGAVVLNLLAAHSFRRRRRTFLRLPSGRTVQVVGLMLEAPALDWRRIVESVLAASPVPSALSGPALRLALLRSRLDPSVLSPLSRLDVALHGRLPLLLVHQAGDEVVPVALSDALAGAWPGVSYLRLPSAGHASAYNADVRAFTSAFAGLLTASALA